MTIHFLNSSLRNKVSLILHAHLHLFSIPCGDIGSKISARNKELEEEVGQITLFDYVVKIPTICTDSAIV